MKSKADRLINLYNKLTDVDYLSNDDNFLESIKYKMNNGNRLLEVLSALEDKNIPFSIVKGFLLNDASYDKFEKCIIIADEPLDVSEFNKRTDITIKLLDVDTNLYEIALIPMIH